MTFRHKFKKSKAYVEKYVFVACSQRSAITWPIETISGKLYKRQPANLNLFINEVHGKKLKKMPRHIIKLSTTKILEMAINSFIPFGFLGLFSPIATR